MKKKWSFCKWADPVKNSHDHFSIPQFTFIEILTINTFTIMIVMKTSIPKVTREERKGLYLDTNCQTERIISVWPFGSIWKTLFNEFIFTWSVSKHDQWSTYFKVLTENSQPHYLSFYQLELVILVGERLKKIYKCWGMRFTEVFEHIIESIYNHMLKVLLHNILNIVIMATKF